VVTALDKPRDISAHRSRLTPGAPEIRLGNALSTILPAHENTVRGA